MRVLTNNKRFFLILLFVFPMILAMSSLIPNVQAGPDIPELHPNNGWHWGIDEGDQLYFETELIITNLTSGEVDKMFKDIWIYNISSIENTTINWLGMTEVSLVNAAQCYYNITEGELQAYGPPSELVLFGYNSTDPIEHRIKAGQVGMPLVLPLNSSSIEVDKLGPIINETFYYPMGELYFNKFDNYTTDDATNRIRFSNSTEGYFTDGYYFDNGTFNTGTAYLKIDMGEPMSINATMKQVFDYNVTDEIKWGVSIGETFYYDWYEDSDPMGEAYDVKVEVTSISDVLKEKNENTFSDDPIQMTYQVVYGNISVWNGVEYELDISDAEIGVANNFYPQYFDESGPSMFYFLRPISASLEDYGFMWNNDTLRIWNTPYDEIHYYENGFIESVLKNSTSSEFVNSKLNKSTGIVQSMIMKQESGFLYYEIKNMTLVDWSVNPGDVLYLKDNGEEPRDNKVTILGSFEYFINMTYLFQMYNLMGIPGTLPSDQPELQFFTAIYAEIEEWDYSSQSWVYDDSGIIGIGNKNWPLCPAIFGLDPPLPPILLPENTDSDKFLGFFEIYVNVYDEISYTEGHVLLRNSTLDRELHFYFNETSGRITMMNGWSIVPIPGEEWTYGSTYLKHYQALAPGVNAFTLNDAFSTGVIIEMTIEIGGIGTGAALLYNYFPMNPVNVSIPSGTPIGYFDQLIANYSLVVGNITMTMTLPLSLDLNDIDLVFASYNMSGTLDWSEATPDFYDTLIYDYSNNSVTIETTPWGDISMISVMAYVIPPDTTPPAAPSGLVATTGGSTTIILDWNDNTEPDFDEYEIHRSTTPGFAPGSSTLIDTTSDSYYSDTGLAPNTTYYYVVIAVDTSNNPSTASSEVSATTDSEAGPGEDDIPGYDLFMISLMIIMMSGLLIWKVRKK